MSGTGKRAGREAQGLKQLPTCDMPSAQPLIPTWLVNTTLPHAEQRVSHVGAVVQDRGMGGVKPVYELALRMVTMCSVTWRSTHIGKTASPGHTDMQTYRHGQPLTIALATTGLRDISTRALRIPTSRVLTAVWRSGLANSNFLRSLSVALLCEGGGAGGCVQYSR